MVWCQFMRNHINWNIRRGEKRKRRGGGKKGQGKAETHLITANLRSNIVQSLNDPQAQFLALLVLLHGNILDMTHHSQGVNKFALHDQTAGTDNPVLSVTNHQHIVLVIAGGDPVIPLVPRLLTDVADGGQDAKDVQVAALVVGAAQGPNGIVGGEDGDDFGRDERRGKEGTVFFGVDGSDGGVHDGLGGSGDGGGRQAGGGHRVVGVQLFITTEVC